MHEIIGQALSVFFGLFAVMNPIANTPVFIALTARDSPDVTRRVALKALSLTFAIVVLFCVLGRVIFELFGITLPAFRITGGFLVVLIGFHMLQGDSSSVQSPKDGEGSDADSALSVAVSPLAVPILAGPGTIATAMSFVATGGLVEVGVTAAAFFVLCAITFFCFVRGERMVKFLGPNGMSMITRMMGLILAVIGVQMAIDGIKGAFALT